MSDTLEQLDSSELAVMVTDKEAALGAIDTDQLIVPSPEILAGLYSSAFVEDEDWEITSIDMPNPEEGYLEVSGVHRGSDAPFTFELSITNVQPVIEG